jgi:hypothetical protein
MASMKAATVDKLIWTLIYGGLVAAGLGGSVQRSDDALGWTLVLAGAAVSIVGVALIVVRSRMKNDST